MSEAQVLSGRSVFVSFIEEMPSSWVFDLASDQVTRPFHRVFLSLSQEEGRTAQDPSRDPPSELSLATRFYAAQFLAHVTSGVLFQPLYVMWAFQTASRHQLSTRAAFDLVRANPDKRLWDGLLVKIAHHYSYSVSHSLLQTGLCRAFNVPSPATKHYVGPGESIEGLQIAFKAKAWDYLCESLLSECSHAIISCLLSPLAAVRSRLEAQGVSAELPIRWTGAAAFIQCFRDIVDEEGIEALFSGLLLELRTPAIAIATSVGAFALTHVLLNLFPKLGDNFTQALPKPLMEAFLHPAQ